VTAWGWNDDGQATVPDGLADVVAIAAGETHSLALHADGTVTAWGGDPYYEQATVPDGLAGVEAIAAGYRHSLALLSNGTVTGWGYDFAGQATAPDGLVNVVAIAGGGGHSLALHADGTVTAWGWNDDGQTDVPDGLDDVVAIAAGIFHSVALRSDGTVTAWGYNTLGQTDVPVGLTGVVAIAAGVMHNLALVARPSAHEFIGFDSPVENPPAVNLAIAGRTIPLKWRLLDSDGEPVTDLASAQVTTTLSPILPGATVDPVEEYATGKSGLQNLGNGYYQYNWATPKSYAKTARTLTLDLGPQGGTHELLFTFS
jgi:hypothetical protein